MATQGGTFINGVMNPQYADQVPDWMQQQQQDSNQPDDQPKPTDASGTPPQGSPEVSPKGPGMPTNTDTNPVTTPPPAAPAATDFSAYNNGTGMPPWLAQIYNDAGVKALDAGTGFKDWRYWSDKQDQADRLKADLAGKGTDTPGPGDYGNTSRDPNAGRSSGVPGVGLGSMGNLMSMMMGPIAMGYNAFGPQGNSVPYDSSMAVPSSSLGDYGVNMAPSNGIASGAFSGTPSQTFTDTMTSTDPNTGLPVTNQMSSALMKQLLAQTAPKSPSGSK